MHRKNMDYSAVATTVADDYEEDGVFQETPTAIEMKKVGHSLFGCCWDTRRGTIVVGIIIIITSTISRAIEGNDLFVVKSMNSNLSTIFDSNNATFGGSNDTIDLSGGFGMNDDLMSSTLQEIIIDMQVMIVYSVFGILFAITSIYGAAVFKIWPVAINVAFLLVYSLFYLVTDEAYFEFAIASLWMYPQIMFIVEVQKGIMPSMTYTHEA